MTTELLAPHSPEAVESTSILESRNMTRRLANRQEEPEISFVGMWRILCRRKKVIGRVAISVFVLTALYFVLSPSKYQSTAIVEFNRQNVAQIDLDQSRDNADGASSSEYSLIQLTQARVLESDSLALRVIQELNLESRPEFSRRQSIVDWFRRLPDESYLPLEQAPYRRTNVLKAWRKALKVEPIPGTQMTAIKFLNPDPQIAAAITNRLISDYKDQYFESHYAATLESSGWLANQLAVLKNELLTSQQQMVDYQKEVGILGTDETHNIVMSRLEELNRQLMISENNRILSDAVVQVVRSQNPEFISGLAAPSIAIGSVVSKDALVPLENLRAQKQQIDLQYANDMGKFGPAYPKLQELQNQRKEVEVALQEEVSRLRTKAENDFLTASNAESALRVSFEHEKEAANKLNDKAIRYTILRHEVESNRDLYDGLLKKLKEAGLLAGLHSTNILVIDPARPSDRPAKPSIPMCLAAGLLGGLLLGVGSGLLAENLDESVTTGDDAERLTMLPTLGMIPGWKSAKKLQVVKPLSRINPENILAISHPHCHSAEAFRAVRTAISQSIRPGTTTVMLMTSALPGEGKTTIALNCAAVFAQQGSKVLLVEADLRKPKFHRLLNLAGTKGLTSMIQGEVCRELPIKLPDLPSLSVVPAGPSPSYPAELLGSARMKQLISQWRTEYEFIVFDTPAALAVTDAIVLAPCCDVSILIARSRITHKQSLLRASFLLRNSKPRALGLIINSIELDSSDYSSYYGYAHNSAIGAA